MEDRFQRVWDRVSAKGPEAEQEKLAAFIREELRDAADYTDMIRRTGSTRVKKLLAHLAAEESGHARRLQAAAYMLSGRTIFMPKKTQNHNERILASLRRRYASEQSSADAYGRAAAASDNEILRKLYADIAAEEEKHAAELCALLERML